MTAAVSPTFAGVQPKPGAVVRERVTVGALGDGTPVRLPVVVIAGKQDGPTVYLQSGVHGDEVTGIRVLLGALERIDPAEVRGTIVAAPVANIASYLTKSRGFALEERGPFDMNRIFPGNAHGVLSERIASVLFDEFVMKSDMTIDFHAALAGCDIFPFVYIDPADDEGGTLALREKVALAFGTTLAYRKKRGSKLGTSVMTGSISTQAEMNGKATVAFEMGQSGHVSWDLVEFGAAGAINALRAMGSLPGPAKENTSVEFFSTIKLVHSDVGGLFEPKVSLGQKVREGQHLADLIDVGTGARTKVTAPANGTVLRIILGSVVMTGAELFWVVF